MHCIKKGLLAHSFWPNILSHENTNYSTIPFGT